MLDNIKISTKVYGLVGILLALLVTAASTGIYQMAKIGEEIVAVAEIDIPLTEKITNITIHQLEQAVLLERGFATGATLSTNPNALKHFKELEKKFIELGHKLELELDEAEKILAAEIEVAYSPEMKTEFEKLLTMLKKAHSEHKEYEKHSEEAFKLLGRGELLNQDSVAKKISEEEDQIIHELEAALVSIQSFTADAMLTAEQHEKSGISLMIAISIAALIAGGILAFFLTRSITTPVIEMTAAMEVLSGGDREVEIPGVGRGDEVGTMANSVQVFKENLIKAEELAKAQRQEEETQRIRSAKIEQLTTEFDRSIAGTLEVVASSANEMEATARSLSATAEQTSQQATAVAAASEEASTNVQTVAAASEELGGSISEISRQVGQSTNISTKAVEDARKTNKDIQQLAEAADRIGEVVSLITDIAEQTNLLALNATIEAARAGDAGKGFAVVASEVKNLANQTAKATEEISSQIGGIQTSTRNAVTAIEGIGSTIEEINVIASTIAAAVEEQNSATQEIARNVEQAAAGTNEVNINMAGVNQAAAETGGSATEVLEATNNLNGETAQLRNVVEDFLTNIRAA